MTQLTPTAFQALTSIGFNSAFQTTQLVGQRLSNLRQGGLAFDGSGLGTAVAMLGSERNRGLTPNQFDPSSDPASAYAVVNPIAPNSAFDAMASASSYPTKAPRAVVDDTPWGMFVYGNALFARQAATANSPQSKFNAAGVTGGIDRRVTQELTLGLLAGYSRTNADLDTVGSTSRINTWLLGAYASYARQNWYVDGALIYGRNSYDNNRMALGTSNVSSPKGDQIALQSTFGIDYRFGVWTVTPEIGAQYTSVHVDGFTETGAAALAIDADRANSLRSSLGARFRYDVLSAWGKLTPELRASWQHEFLDRDRDVRASFVDQTLPGNFATTAAGSGTDFGVLGAGVNMFVADRTQLSVGYDFKFGGHSFTAHQLSGRLRHTF
jgi:outer membrane autotransporter protein